MGGFAAAAAAALAADAEAEADSTGDAGMRAPRCTGSAMSAAVSLMAACTADGAARAITFSGGPAVGGAGAIVDAAVTSAIRGHKELAAQRKLQLSGLSQSASAAAHYGE